MPFSTDTEIAAGARCHADAVALIARGVREVPLYRWLLGDGDRDDREVLWAELLLAAHGGDGARGCYDQTGSLRGVALFAAPGRTPPTYADTLRDRTRAMVHEVPGFLERYREMSTAEARYQPSSSPLDIVFAAVDASSRGCGMLAELVDPLVEAADRAGVPVLARASDSALAATYERRWGTTPRGCYRVTGGPVVWILQRDPIS